MFSNDEDTIASIITPPGNAGVGIIRISGKQSIEIIDNFFKNSKGKRLSQQKSHSIHYGWFEDNGELIDEGLFCIFKAPHSYTAEDVVEIQSHGNYILLQQILKILIRDSRVRLAEPGEFTHRAFTNGRIDLTKAEAINDLIQAKSLLGIDQAVNQLKGKLYTKIDEIREEISWTLALSNAGVDFPEEDVVFSHQKEILAKLENAKSQLQNLIDSAEKGKLIKNGLHVILVGEPNVGKSSLMNELLQEDRAIVTDIPGTTRDSIEESIEINGLLINLIDTAGVRVSADQIEQEGVNRSFKLIEKADLVLWLIDSESMSFKNEIIESLKNQAKFILFNKSDLVERSDKDIPSDIDYEEMLLISVKKKQGITSLKDKVFQFAIRKGNQIDGIGLTNIRQKEAAQIALEDIKRSINTLQEGFGEEYLAVDLNAALDSLGTIVGETTTDDMLNKIFANFCIGK